MYEKIKNLQRQRTFIDNKIVKLEAEAGTDAIKRIANMQNYFDIEKHNAIATFIKQLERFQNFLKEAAKHNRMVKYLRFTDTNSPHKFVSMSANGISRISIYCIDQRFSSGEGNQKAYTATLQELILSHADVLQFNKFAQLMEATTFNKVADAWADAQSQSNDSATILI